MVIKMPHLVGPWFKQRQKNLLGNWVKVVSKLVRVGCFKSTNHIIFKSVCGEGGSIDQQVRSWKTKLSKLIKDMNLIV